MMHDETICLWCAAPVTLRRGGSPKKFCSARCRHEFHSCARRWAEAAVAAGALSVDVLKNGDLAACTLVLGTIPAAAVSEAPLIKRRVPTTRNPSKNLTSRQRAFIDEYLVNGQNGAAAFRKAYNSKASSSHCSAEAHRLLGHPNISRVLQSRNKIIALAQEKRLEEQVATEERIIETIAALAFYDPRQVVQWGPGGVTITVSSDLPYRSVLAIKDITILHGGGVRIRFPDRRAALMDLARLRGMITDKSATFAFHEDLARMTPDQQKRRVAELLEFAASIRVPRGGRG
jgi:phage terminase small subunit